MTSPSPMAQPIHGWPSTWYDLSGSIPCPARHCTQVFDTRMQWSRRWQHFDNEWGHREEVPETHTDHQMLSLFMQQDKCPHCDWAIKSSKQDITALFEHENREHGSRDTTDINGFVRLVRRQALGQLGEQARELVFWRFCQKLKAHKDFAMICQFLGHDEDEIPIPVANTLLLNRPAGQTVFYPIPPEEFLIHLEPKDSQEAENLRWLETWNDLRVSYNDGFM
ncbi:hypothetical protein N7G274_005100 [Stereocaulon virgatum]|uniref:C2H2-type domain-containing protein n=1 Tax=Stereocaulon virgatum TaxID=373712 RepID=A0ABR4AA10_9LECA